MYGLRWFHVVAMLAGVALISLSLVACSDDNTTSQVEGGVMQDGAQVYDSALSQDSGQLHDGAPPQVDAPPAKKLEEYIPGDGFVAGWTLKGAASAAYTYNDIKALVDPMQDDYAGQGLSAFGMAVYENGDKIIALTIWQMDTAVGAKFMFNQEKGVSTSQDGVTFAELASVPDEVVVGESGHSGWLAHAHTGVYVYGVVSHMLPPKLPLPQADSDAMKAGLTEFVTKLATSLPQ